jgi:hypothetical protein
MADYIVTHLDELTARGLPPSDPDDEGMTVVSSRRQMFLPTKCVPLPLNPKGYTLCQAWEILYPTIVAANDLQNCATLLKWMRLISTGTTVANNANAIEAMTATLTLTAPLADQDLIQHHHRLHKVLLPALFQPAENLEFAITQMAAAVTQNTNESRRVHEEKVAQATEPALPSKKYKAMLHILLEFLEVPNEVDLPPLWHSWANCNKRQEFSVLTDQLHLFACGPNTFSPNSPVVSICLVQDLQNSIFISEALDDIKTGLQPFIIADGSTEHCQANLELSCTYGMLNLGENSLLLADLEALKAKEVQSIPLTYFELERNLGMFGNLLAPY